MDADTVILSRAQEIAPDLDQPLAAIGDESQRPQFSPSRKVLVAVRWPVGGIRTHVLYNYPTLARLGYEFSFVGPADETFKTFADSLTSLGRAEFIGVHVNGKRCALWRELRRQLRTDQFDLVHAHGVTAAVHTSLANTGLNYPQVATVHDVFRPCHFAGVTGVVKRLALAFLINQADALIAVSEDVRQNLFDYLPSLRKRATSISAIANGIQSPIGRSACQRPPMDLRERLNISGNVRLVGFLGRFMEQKGFLPLVGALHELSESGLGVRFHLLAVGSGDYRNEYQAAVHRLGLANQVTFLDFTPDVRTILGQLDLLVIPSQWEASSLLAMEAMAEGVPILGTDCIGLREVLRGTPARTVPTGDVKALAAGLREGLEAPWTEAAKHFAATARARFDNAPSARKLAAIFDRLIRVHRSRRLSPQGFEQPRH